LEQDLKWRKQQLGKYWVNLKGFNLVGAIFWSRSLSKTKKWNDYKGELVSDSTESQVLDGGLNRSIEGSGQYCYQWNKKQWAY
jgi:hypothetical protein